MIQVFRIPILLPPRIVAAFGLLACALPADAGFVTWELPHTIAGDSDVSAIGTLVAAHNLGTFGNSSATINGVTFTPFPTSAPVNVLGNVTMSAAGNVQGDNFNFGDFFPPFSNLSNSYQTLIQSGSFTSGLFPPPEITMTFSGLTVGTEYRFQWWVNQSSLFSSDPGGAPPVIPTTMATAGGSVSLQRGGVDPGSVGQFATGTFTADAVAQVFKFNGSDTRTLLNAFQLRALPPSPIPEPGSCLIAFALSGVVFRSMFTRRRTPNPTSPL